ncbi:hypothetical protein GFK91_30890 (plasmid) [Roseibium aggregatum]|uniref:dioxygenase family protein n=1 Tax=Roseibium aggregatum TaxID=187304 RepID=UPI003A7F587C|nr:hypothetical protein GFK91_30125 [Roseibium aggregatum]UES60158.1 hypothetical protein GFK91_30890 [Roseibium aggregatum]
MCDGRYDNDGYHLRGHRLSAVDGSWRFETVLPATYPPRSRHIHLKVQRPGSKMLTTQMFFPGDPEHARDRQFDSRLLMQTACEDGHLIGRFDLVLA